MDLSQFTSESEDYELPAGSTAVAVLGAVIAVPAIAFSLAAIPVAWVVHAISGRKR